MKELNESHFCGRMAVEFVIMGFNFTELLEGILRSFVLLCYQKSPVIPQREGRSLGLSSKWSHHRTIALV